MRDYRRILIIVLTLTLAGCASQSLQQEQEAEVDLFDLRERADEAYEQGDMAAGEKHYSALIEEVPGEAKPWFRLANIYARTDRPGAAVRAYREALIRDPEMSKAWYNMGIVQLREAAHSFNELQVYADPEDPLYTQGRTLLEGIMELIGDDNDR